MAAKKNQRKTGARVRTVTLCDRDSRLAGRVEFATHVLELLDGLKDDMGGVVAFDNDEDSAERTDLALRISRRTVGVCADLVRKLRAIDASNIGKKPAPGALPS